MIEKEFIILEPTNGKVLKSSEIIEYLNDRDVEYHPNTECKTFIEMNDFERLTIRYAVYEALKDSRDHYCEEELESLQAMYERLDPTKVEHDKEGN